VVTAAAAIDSGKYNPDSIVDGHSPRVISGAPLSNFGGENFGPISLTDALTNSVNTVWAQVGESLGRGTLEKYMDRFGFNRRPPIDYPSDELTASGVYSGGKVVGSEQQFDVGRVAIGEGGAEGQILVTPLQMAMVAAAIGNKGVLMRPRFADKIVDKDGRVKESFNPEQVDRVISEKTAGQLAQMMANVVKEGTGTASNLQGIQVAGKTGTAQVANNTANQAWFIAFAPVDNPKMAIAVTVERTQDTGGVAAAPIARQVLQSLIGG
jgi:peptidoglycan glycosyltransferase